MNTGKEPPWIVHDGSDVCPVPAGHDVEVDFGTSATHRFDNTRRCNFWPVVKRYRDWTAFAQASEPVGGVPKWAIKMKAQLPALEYCIENPSAWDAFSQQGSDNLAVAVHLMKEAIAAYEPPRDDPLRELFKDVTGVILSDLELRTLRARLPAAVAAVEGEG